MRKNYQNLKTALCLVAFAITSLLSAQGLTVTFANAQNTSESGNDFYEADIMVESTTDFTLGSGQLYFDYSNAAFGSRVFTNGSFTFERPMGSILGSGGYASFVTNDTFDQTVSISFQQGFSQGTLAKL